MIAHYVLGPLGLLVSALGIWSVSNAWKHGRVRSHGWVEREVEPKFFWFIVVATAFATLWFGLIGGLVSARLMGLIQ